MDEPLTRLEVNCETGEVTTHILTQEELDALALAQAQAEADAQVRAAEQAAAEAKKADVLAKLSALTGLTADDLKSALNA